MDGWRKRHRYIDDDVVEPLPQQTEHVPHARFGDIELRIQLLVGGNQANPVVDLDRRAFEKQRVRAHRIFQRDAQTGPRPDAQHHRRLAVLQMKVEQRDLGLGGLGQLQGEIDRDAGGAGAALRAADRDHMTAAIDRIGRDVAKQLRAQLVQHHVPRERPAEGTRSRRVPSARGRR